MVPAAPTVQVAVAVTKLPPSGGGEKVSVGTAVYPTPILVKSIELTVPVSETIAAVAAPTYAASGMDGNTAMSAAEGAKIVADILELNTKLAAVLAALEKFGVTDATGE